MWLDFASAFLQKFLEIVIPVVAALIAGYVAVGIRKLIAEIKVRLDDNQEAMIDQIVHAAVLAAEQVGLKDSLIDKKEYAIEFAQDWLAEKGIKLNLSILANLIEAAVMDEFNRGKAELTEGAG